MSRYVKPNVHSAHAGRFKANKTSYKPCPSLIQSAKSPSAAQNYGFLALEDIGRLSETILPEKELLLKFRHVYAGKGGWYGFDGGHYMQINTKHLPKEYRDRIQKRLSTRSATSGPRCFSSKKKNNRLSVDQSPVSSASVVLSSKHHKHTERTPALSATRSRKSKLKATSGGIKRTQQQQQCATGGETDSQVVTTSTFSGGTGGDTTTGATSECRSRNDPGEVDSKQIHPSVARSDSERSASKSFTDTDYSKGLENRGSSLSEGTFNGDNAPCTEKQPCELGRQDAASDTSEQARNNQSCGHGTDRSLSGAHSMDSTNRTTECDSPIDTVVNSFQIESRSAVDSSSSIDNLCGESPALGDSNRKEDSSETTQDGASTPSCDCEDGDSMCARNEIPRISGVSKSFGDVGGGDRIATGMIIDSQHQMIGGGGSSRPPRKSTKQRESHFRSSRDHGTKRVHVDDPAFEGATRTKVIGGRKGAKPENYRPSWEKKVDLRKGVMRNNKQQPADNAGNDNELHGEETDRSTRRKMNLFSRLSQEAQFALCETRREMGLSHEIDPGSKRSLPQKPNRHQMALEALEGDYSIYMDEPNQGYFSTNGKWPATRRRSSVHGTYETPITTEVTTRNNAEQYKCKRLHKEILNLSLVPQEIDANSAGDAVRKRNIINNQQRRNHEDTSPVRSPITEQVKPIPLLGARKPEQTFVITPMNYDSRFTDMPVTHLDPLDDTPVEIKEAAIEKCTEWLDKYWA